MLAQTRPYQCLKRPALAGWVLLSLALFSACRNGVPDTQEERTQRVEVATLSLREAHNITQDPTPQSAIEGKYYLVEACLMESALGEKLVGHPAKLESGGGRLASPLTDSNGCLYWEHRIDYDYSALNFCRQFSKTVSLAGGQYRIQLDYTIDIHTDKISDLSKSQGCLVQQHLSESGTPAPGDDTEELAGNSGQRPIPDLEIDPIHFTYLRGNGLQPSDTKELSYRARLSTCLRYRSASAPVGHTTLRIRVRNEKGEAQEDGTSNSDIVETNHQGCFFKYFQSSYPQYSHSHWRKKTLEVTLLNGPLRTRRISQVFYINPWENKNPEIFGIDARYGRPSENPEPQFNQLHLDRVSYVRVGNNIEEFKVNNYLGLTIAKTYHVTLTPAIDRGHLFGTQSERYVPLNNGTFKLKFMLLAPHGPDVMIDENNYTDFDYIAGAEKIVDVRGGSINVPVDLAIRFADLPRVATRVICAIKLEPISDIGLRPAVGIGFFMAKRPWIRTNVFFAGPLQRDESEFFADFTPGQRRDIEDRMAAQDLLAFPEIDASLENTPAVAMEPGTPLSSNLVRLRDFQEMELSELQRDELKKRLYKGFIEQHFGKITQITQNYIYSDPEVFRGDRPLAIFLNHLKHRLGNVTFQTADEPGNLIPFSNRALTDFHQRGFASPEGQEIARRLCQTLFVKTGVWDRLLSGVPNQLGMCQDHPELFFDMERYKHSVAIDRSIPLWSNGMEFSIGSRLLVGQRNAMSTVFSRRVGADLGRLDAPPGIPLLSYLAPRVRLYDITYSWHNIRSEESSLGDHVFVQKRIGAEKFNIWLEGLFENCVLLKAKYYQPGRPNKNVGDSWNHSQLYGISGGIFLPLGRHFYFCTRPQYEDIVESYYYIQAYAPNTTLMRDSFGPTEMKFISVIRNTANFAQFKKTFDDNTKVYLLEDRVASETPDIKLYQEWGHLIKSSAEPSAVNKIMLRNIDGGYPGTIQLPAVNIGENCPFLESCTLDDFWQRVVNPPQAL